MPSDVSSQLRTNMTIFIAEPLELRLEKTLC